MEMYISAVFAMKIFRLIKVFSNSIKCGEKTVQKANIDTRDSVGREWEMAEGKRQGIKDGGKKQNIQKIRNGKLFADNNMFVDVLD